MTSLYSIANDYAKLMDEDFDPDFIADTLEGIEGEMEDKIGNCLAVIKNELSYAETLKTEAKKFVERAKRCEERAERVKAYVAESMETAGKKSLKAGVHQVSVRAPSKSVEITDENALPSDYVDYVTSIKPDKLAIKKQLEAGVDVPGAQIKTGKPSLIIK